MASVFLTESTGSIVSSSTSTSTSRRGTSSIVASDTVHCRVAGLASLSALLASVSTSVIEPVVSAVAGVSCGEDRGSSTAVALVVVLTVAPGASGVTSNTVSSTVHVKTIQTVTPCPQQIGVRLTHGTGVDIDVETVLALVIADNVTSF